MNKTMKSTNAKSNTFLSIQEAATALSMRFKKVVIEADILKLALDKKIKISVELTSPIKAVRGKIVDQFNTEWVLDHRPSSNNKLPPELERGNPACPPSLEQQWECAHPELLHEYYPILQSTKINEDIYLNFETDTEELLGFFSLPMLGGEKEDIEHKYNLLTDRPTDALKNSEACYIEDECGKIFKILIHKSEYEFSEETSELQEIKKKIKEQKIQRPEAQQLLATHKSKFQNFYQDAAEKYEQVRFTKLAEREKYETALSLPINSQIVIKNEEIERFSGMETIKFTDDVTEVFSNSEITLLVIFNALLKFKNYDYKKRGQSKIIEIDTKPFINPVGKETIRLKFVKISTALKSGQIREAHYESVDAQNKNIKEIETLAKSKLKENGKQLERRERNIYLTMIAGLCNDTKLNYLENTTIEIVSNLPDIKINRILSDEIRIIFNEIREVVRHKEKEK
ncbi:hypothetical protein [Sapientia aquatica]|uniref:Uncharacterized protein n=1 Tax=Sapientia aquatica TaxID=1549640 RepID=A0A4R5VRV7_9BURK|nr:hypothetical protein [Sapientia aquatica]TDK61206.1 hypothetical protein E2I14_17605 [Sapientia aquatica]